MFIFVEGQHSFEVQREGQTFQVRCQQETGRQFEAGVQALADIAYDKVTGKYMPSAEMIEYYTALQMGVKIEPPEMDWSGDVDY